MQRNMKKNYRMEWKIFSVEWKENCQYGKRKNRLPFHTMPSLQIHSFKEILLEIGFIEEMRTN